MDIAICISKGRCQTRGHIVRGQSDNAQGVTCFMVAAYNIVCFRNMKKIKYASLLTGKLLLFYQYILTLFILFIGKFIRYSTYCTLILHIHHSHYDHLLQCCLWLIKQCCTLFVTHQAIMYIVFNSSSNAVHCLWLMKQCCTLFVTHQAINVDCL